MQNGTETLIGVDTGNGFAVLGSQRNASISETNDIIDASSKKQREREVLAGRYEANYSFEALYVPSNAAFQALRAAMRNGYEIKLREQESGTDVEECSAIISDMTREFPDQDVATISLEAAVNGAFTPL